MSKKIEDGDGEVVVVFGVLWGKDGGGGDLWGIVEEEWWWW